MRIRTKLVIIAFGTLIFLIAFGVAAYQSLERAGSQARLASRYVFTHEACLSLLKAASAVETELEGERNEADLRQALNDLERRATIPTTGTPSQVNAAQLRQVVEETVAAGRTWLDEEQKLEAFQSLLHDVEERATNLREWAYVRMIVGIRSASRGADKRANRFLLGAILTVVSLALLNIGLIHALLTRPLHHLYRGVRHFKEDPNYRLPQASEADEVGEIAREFNEMADRVQAALRELENRIEDRTSALRQVKSDLRRHRHLAAVGRLAAGVAHEINNPLACIAGAAEGLLDRAEDESLADLDAFEDFPTYLETIEREAYRAKAITRSLLDFSRGSEGTPHEIDLRKLVERAVNAVEVEYGREISVELPGDPVVCTVDEDPVERVCRNLLTNALDATADLEESRVSVELKQEGGEVQIRVTDNGQGIEPDVQEQVFEPFFTTKPVGKGTGLGLAICHGIIKAHRGEIQIESEGDGQGTRVIVRLPGRNEVIA